MTRNEGAAAVAIGCGCLVAFAGIGTLAGVVMARRASSVEVAPEPVPPVTSFDPALGDPTAFEPPTESPTEPPVLAPADRFEAGHSFRGQMDCAGQEPSTMRLRFMLASPTWAVAQVMLVEYPRTETGARTSRRMEHRLEGAVEGRTARLRFTDTVRGRFDGAPYDVVATLDQTGRTVTGTTTRTGCTVFALTRER